MKDITDLTVVQIRVFAVDVIPIGQLMTETFVQKIKESFKFGTAYPRLHMSTTDPAMVQEASPIITFMLGEFYEGETRTVINYLTIEPRRIIIGIQGTSSQGDSFYDAIKELISGYDKANRFASTEPIVKAEETSCVVSLDFDLYKCFSKPFIKFLKKNLKEHTSSKQTESIVSPFRLDALIRYHIQDKSITDHEITVNPKHFFIEARTGTPAGEHRFSVSSPTDSDTHLQLIKKFEFSLKADKTSAL